MNKNEKCNFLLKQLQRAPVGAIRTLGSTHIEGGLLLKDVPDAIVEECRDDHNGLVDEYLKRLLWWPSRVPRRLRAFDEVCNRHSKG